ncbi:MAG: tetratricopeptide repeat protein [Candidatus Omnitrophica bacterium]|nr:tetratricopeptide repeat protein [Candidatus Omnitrophota bacterium]
MEDCHHGIWKFRVLSLCGGVCIIGQPTMFRIIILIMLFLPAAALSEENPHYVKGMELLDDNNYRGAEKEFLIFLKDVPASSRAHNTLGFIYYKLGENEKAARNYKQAIALDSGYAIAHNNLGILYYHGGAYENAKKCFEKAIEHNPLYAKAMINLGLVYLNTGDKKSAKTMCLRAKEADKEYVRERERSARKRKYH